MTWWCVLQALSMLARYQPAEWASHIAVDTSRHAVAIEQLMAASLKAVPELIMATLRDVGQATSERPVLDHQGDLHVGLLHGHPRSAQASRRAARWSRSCTSLPYGHEESHLHRWEMASDLVGDTGIEPVASSVRRRIFAWPALLRVSVVPSDLAIRIG